MTARRAPAPESRSRIGKPNSFQTALLLFFSVLACSSLVTWKARGKFDMVASWYGADFNGKVTASGEPYNMYALTAAHKSLPLGTLLKVTWPRNGKTVLVTINDRGPFIQGRDLDLSYAAAQQLDCIADGVISVKTRWAGHDRRYDRYIKTTLCPASQPAPTVPVPTPTK